VTSTATPAPLPAPVYADLPAVLAAARGSQAVTIIGGNERGGSTRLLLDNLQAAWTGYTGRINVVNRRSSSVYGLPTVPSLADVEGDIGLAWILLPSAVTVETVTANERPMSGLVVFSAGFREAGNHGAEAALVDWARATQTLMMGPQSLGCAFFSHHLNALDVPLKHPVLGGDVAVMAQSGGMTVAILAALTERGIGANSAFSLGNEAAVDFASLGRALVDDDDVGMLAIYAESVKSELAFADLASQAALRGKPVILLPGGISAAGRRLASSHTGALAGRREVMEGIAEQFGVIIVRSVDDLANAAATVRTHQGQPLGLGRTGVFSNTAGLNVIITDRLAEAGVTLRPLSPDGQESLDVAGPGAISNPFDSGGGMLGRPDEFTRRVTTFVADPAVDIAVHCLYQVPGEAALAHQFRYREFVRACQTAGKPGVVSIAFQESNDGARTMLDVFRSEAPSGITVARGLADTVSSIRALSRRAAASTAQAGRPGPAAAGPAAGATRVLADRETRAVLSDVDLRWPASVLVLRPDDIGAVARDLRFPVVAKAAVTGLAHRARAGAVILGIPDAPTAVTAFAYLNRRFGTGVEFSAQIEHDDEIFVGLTRTDSGLTVLGAGPGGAALEHGASLRVLPLSGPQIERTVDACFPHLPAGPLITLIGQLQELVAGHPEIESLDMNPLVVDAAGGLTVLDAKLHVYAGSAGGG
jgi:acetate---CoA ligase (ADP-forming)